MKRILATIALTATIITGGATATSAAPVKHTSVKTCESALIWSHAVKGEARIDREDRAMIICARTVTTDRQASALYKWAGKHKWALDIIG